MKLGNSQIWMTGHTVPVLCNVNRGCGEAKWLHVIGVGLRCFLQEGWGNNITSTIHCPKLSTVWTFSYCCFEAAYI